MTYELAKELKETGFPQRFEPPFDFYYPEKDENEDGVQHCSGQQIDSGCYGLGIDDYGNIEDWNLDHKYDEKPVSVLIKAPTLSELIEACGGVLLWGCKPHGYFASKQFCPVENKTPESVIEADAEATTPEEAVARLWLALNKKS